MGARGYVRDHGMEKYVRDALGRTHLRGHPRGACPCDHRALYDEEDDDF